LLIETLPASIADDIVRDTGATDIQVEKNVTELWGGYGGIFRLHLHGAAHKYAVLKLIKPPEQAQHPRGWNTSNSHNRKIRSYQIETHWYTNYASLCGEHCRVPLTLATGSNAVYQWILMEDLTSQYPLHASSLSLTEAFVCLQWLATFHARFIGATPLGLWPRGTYWHLDTRQDELYSMPDGELKACAAKLDNQLNECPYQTIVHGDAKVANFCFSADKSAVAADRMNRSYCRCIFPHCENR